MFLIVPVIKTNPAPKLFGWPLDPFLSLEIGRLQVQPAVHHQWEALLLDHVDWHCHPANAEHLPHLNQVLCN